MTWATIIVTDSQFCAFQCSIQIQIKLITNVSLKGITCEVARIDEEIALLDKAEAWAADDLNPEAGLGDPDTGRTPLHKAAAKGYMKVYFRHFRIILIKVL